VFRSGLFDPLTEQEQKILDLIPARLSKFYIIGTHEDTEDDALEHEICHALYYTNAMYKHDVDTLLNKHIEELVDLKSYLIKIGYCDEVLTDECHAYISEDSEYLKSEKVKYPDITSELQRIKKACLSGKT